MNLTPHLSEFGLLKILDQTRRIMPTSKKSQQKITLADDSSCFGGHRGSGGNIHNMFEKDAGRLRSTSNCLEKATANH